MNYIFLLIQFNSIRFIYVSLLIITLKYCSLIFIFITTTLTYLDLTHLFLFGASINEELNLVYLACFPVYYATPNTQPNHKHLIVGALISNGVLDTDFTFSIHANLIVSTYKN